MNEHHRSTDKNTGNTDGSMGTRIWSVFQKALPMLLVSFVTFLVVDRHNAWTAIGDAEHDLEVHKLEGKRRHALIDQEHIRFIEELDELSDELRECQLQQQRMLETIAKLPPDDTEQQILQNTIDISVLKSRVFSPQELQRWQK